MRLARGQDAACYGSNCESSRMSCGSLGTSRGWLEAGQWLPGVSPGSPRMSCGSFGAKRGSLRIKTRLVVGGSGCGRVGLVGCKGVPLTGHTFRPALLDDKLVKSELLGSAFQRLSFCTSFGKKTINIDLLRLANTVCTIHGLGFLKKFTNQNADMLQVLTNHCRQWSLG